MSQRFCSFVEFLIIEALAKMGKEFKNNMDKFLVDFIAKRGEEKPASIWSHLAVDFEKLSL